MSHEPSNDDEKKPNAAELPHRMTIDEPTGFTISEEGEGDPIVFFPEDEVAE